jgi:hypothetical protein
MCLCPFEKNRVSSLGKDVSSPYSQQKSVDDKTVASSTDSVFERLYRREKRKAPVNIDESTVRTLRTKRDRAKALPSDPPRSPMQPHKGTVASSDSVFERLYRGEKRLIPLSLERSSIRNRTPSLESEVALTRDSERIHKQSVLETLPSLTVKAERAEQSLLKQIVLVAEDSSNDKLLTPTALRCVNCPFDGKGEVVFSSKNVGTSGTLALPDGGVCFCDLYSDMDSFEGTDSCICTEG